MSSLRITEIFYSLQGESLTQGKPTVFVRLTGCPLRCSYCDTAYAFSGGRVVSLEDILDQVRDYGCEFVTVTGGEPLAQPDCRLLLERMAESGMKVSLETSGALDVSGIDPRVTLILDIKTPGSGEVSRNIYDNLLMLKPAADQVKFVLTDKNDYEWAKMKIDEFSLTNIVSEVLMSPVWERLNPADLAAWILQDRLQVRMQIQLHKVLWGNKPGV